MKHPTNFQKCKNLNYIIYLYIYIYYIYIYIYIIYTKIPQTNVVFFVLLLLCNTYTHWFLVHIYIYIIYIYNYLKPEIQTQGNSEKSVINSIDSHFSKILNFLITTIDLTKTFRTAHVSLYNLRQSVFRLYHILT